VLISAALYWAISRGVETAGWPRSTMFLFIAALTLPIALFYHPKHEAVEHPVS
jgi:hypothetical protein